MANIMVVGAAPNSLGDAVVEAGITYGHDVTTVGLNMEDVIMDALEEAVFDDRRGLNKGGWPSVFSAFTPDHVICTVGINEPAGEEGSFAHATFPEWMNRSFNINVVGPLNILRFFLRYLEDKSGHRHQHHFVGISSNSAHIARSNSMAYCASKAALSMALRCAARETKGDPALIYGYELGLLAGTPMTQATEARFGPAQTRMPGAPDGLDRYAVADQIVRTLEGATLGLNGALLRLDAGEQ